MGQSRDLRLGVVDRSPSRSGRSSQGPSVTLKALGTSSSFEPCHAIFRGPRFVACHVRFGLLAPYSFSSGWSRSVCALTHGLLLVVFIVEFQLALQLRFLLVHRLLVLVLLFLVQNATSLAPILISACLKIAFQQHQKGFEASDLFLFFPLHSLAAW